jgi:hypothetical protein
VALANSRRCTRKLPPLFEDAVTGHNRGRPAPSKATNWVDGAAARVGEAWRLGFGFRKGAPVAQPSGTDESVTGESLVSYNRRPRTFRPGRLCRAEGCTTRLSIYNSDCFCAAHVGYETLASPASVLV